MPRSSRRWPGLRPASCAKPACWSGVGQAPAARIFWSRRSPRPGYGVRSCTARIPAAAPAEPPGAEALVAVDDVERADPDAQGRLFTLFNRLQATGGQLVAAAAEPPGRLPLRDDLRTRLGWGLVYELLPLSDAEKPAALARYAAERGFPLSDDVIAYLLAHGRRDMTTLIATLVALDRYSLAAKRPITVPLLRTWLQREIPLRDTGG